MSDDEDINELRRDIAALRQHLDLRLDRNHERQNAIMAQIDDLKTEVANTDTVEQSAIVLLQGLKARLDAAIAAGNDPTQLQALSDDLGVHRQALAAAVTANTPTDTGSTGATGPAGP